MIAVCRHCGRGIKAVPGEGWADPEATGDDSLWRLMCEGNDTEFGSPHAPQVPTPSDDIYVPGLEDA